MTSSTNATPDKTYKIPSLVWNSASNTPKIGCQTLQGSTVSELVAIIATFLGYKGGPTPTSASASKTKAKAKK